MTKSKVLKRISAFLLMVVMMLSMAVPAMAYTAGTNETEFISVTNPQVSLTVNTGKAAGDIIGFRSVVEVGTDGNFKFGADFNTFIKDPAYGGKITLTGVTFTVPTMTLADFASLDPDINYGSQSLTSSYVPQFAKNNNLKLILDGFAKYCVEKGALRNFVPTLQDDGTASVTRSDFDLSCYGILFNNGSNNARIYQTTVYNNLPRLAAEGSANAGKLVVNKDVTIIMKSALPEITKTVTGNSGSNNSVEIGDTLTYTIDATVPRYVDFVANNTDGEGKTNLAPIFYMQDTLTEGLTMMSTVDGDTKVVVKAVSGATETTLTKDTDYTITIVGKVMTIHFNFNSDSVRTADKVTATYRVAVNENAKIGSEGNPNTYDLIYSNTTTSFSDWKKTPSEDDKGFGRLETKKTVKTYGFVINKHIKGNENKPLKDVEFEIYDNAECKGDPIATIKTNEKGEAGYSGLALATYWLKETVTPAGYKPLTEPAQFSLTEANCSATITTTTTINYTTDSDKALVKAQATNAAGVKLWLPTGAAAGTEPTPNATAPAGMVAAYVLSIDTTVNTVNKTPGEGTTTPIAYRPFNIANEPGTSLPETGGIGTTLFYILGSLMVVGAGIVLITKKRMANSEN